MINRLISKKLEILVIICWLCTLVRIDSTKNFNSKHLDLLLVVIQKSANSISSDFVFALHVIMMNILILSKFDHTFCRFEFWVSYTRSLFSIEVSWNDQDSFICFKAEISRLVYSLIWRITVVVIFASRIVDLKNHYRRDFRIEHFSQFIVSLREKSERTSSWMIQKKHDLMISLSAVFNMKCLISYNSQLLIWWLTIDLLTTKFESNSFLLSYFFAFLYQSRYVIARLVKRNRRRIVAIAIDISSFENLLSHSTTYFTFIFNAQSNRAAIFEDVSN